MLRSVTLLAILTLVSFPSAQEWLRAPREIAPRFGEAIRAFADFNGDGRLDLVVTRLQPNMGGIVELRIHFATAGGDYTSGPAIPRYPQGFEGSTYVLAGDLTGDGLPDIVTSLNDLSAASGFVLYRNLGAGTFAAPLHTASGIPGLTNGVLTDWNGDGVMELVALQLNSTFGTLLRWTWQNGAFVSSNALPAVGYIEHLSTGEVTGDGLVDVIAGSSNLNLVYVIPTLPGGGLGPMVPYLVGSSAQPRPRMPSCGDIDGDGDTDIVVGWSTGSFSSAVAIISNDGAGTLSVGATQQFAVNPHGYWNGRPHVVDWDGDGDGDVLLGWEYLRLLENRGANTLQLAASLRVAQSTSSVGSLIDGNDGVGAADFDGDGNLDFAIGRVIVFGLGSFENAYFPAIFSSVQQPLDWDDDGDIDILESGGLLRVDQGRNRFVDRELFPTAPPSFGYSEAIACGDFDGDGYRDLLVSYFQFLFPRGSIVIGGHLLAGGPDGRLRDLGLAAPPAAVNSSWSSFLIEQRDLDGDGDLDVATTGGWWENNGNGTFTTFHAAWTGSPFMIVDVDNDGRLDVLTLESDTQSTVHRLARGRAGGGFVSEVLASEPGGTHLARGILADLDDDGDLDFATGLSAGPIVVIRENQGGTFAPAVTLASREGAFGTLLVDDFDGDGLTDLAALASTIAGHFGNAALVWRRIGPGFTYAAPRAYLAGEPVSTQADLDGDGDLDVYGRYGFVLGGRHAGAAAGSYSQYGEGEPGTSGIAPVLGVRGPVRAGGNIELRARHAQGGAPAALLIGLGFAEVPFLPLPGLTLRVSQPIVLLPVTLQGGGTVPGAGFLDLPLLVPPALFGASLFHQLFAIDGTGFAASNGLEIHYGR